MAKPSVFRESLYLSEGSPNVPFKLNVSEREVSPFEVPVLFRGGGSEIESFCGTVPEIDVENRRINFIADLHIDPRPGKADLDQLRILIDFLGDHPEDLFIFAGDIHEGSYGLAQMLKESVERGRRLDANEYDFLIASFYSLLQQRQTVLLPGNHDLPDWYEVSGFGREFFGLFARRVILKRPYDTLLAEHGDAYYRDSDQQGEEEQNMHEFNRKPFLRLFNETLIGSHPFGLPKTHYSLGFEAVMTGLFKDRFLHWLNVDINEHCRKIVPTLKRAYGVDGILLGHSHLKYEGDGLKISGLNKNGHLEIITLEPGQRFDETSIQPTHYTPWAERMTNIREIFSNLIF